VNADKLANLNKAILRARYVVSRSVSRWSRVIAHCAAFTARQVLCTGRTCYRYQWNMLTARMLYAVSRLRQ